MGMHRKERQMNEQFSFDASFINQASNSLDVSLNGNNNLIYQLKTPFQLTYIAYNSQIQPQIINITTLSGKSSFQYNLKMSDHMLQYSRHMLHFHDYFELLIVLEGTVTQMIENKEYQYAPGSCCLINRSLYHIEDYSDTTRILFIGFSIDFIKKLFEDCKSAEFSQERDILNSNFFHFIMEDLEHPGSKMYLDYIPTITNQRSVKILHDINSRLMEVLLHPVFGATHQIKGIFSQLIATLSDSSCYHCSKISLEQTADALIFSRISHLVEERHGRITREELSRQLNYSGDYINRIVHKFTGLCLFDYSMNFCMKKAADELIYSQKTIHEIATELKFSNQTHFYRLFKEKYGMTPKEFRLRASDSL